jgi:hypothetical protein
MSVASLGLKNVSLTAGDYTTPQIKLNKHGQITFINDLDSGGSLDLTTQQEEYDDLNTTYNTLTNVYNSIISPTGGIPAYEEELVTINTSLTTDAQTLTTADDNLTTAVNNDPISYSEYTLMSNELDLTTTWIFSNTSGNTAEQTLQTIYTGFDVPAGNYLLSAYLSAQVVGGDESKVVNSGSALCLVISYTTDPSSYVAIFQSGRTGEYASVSTFSRNQTSGQQYVSFAADTQVNISFYCSAGAVVGQPSYDNFALSWQIQPFANLGAGVTFSNGLATPSEYYKCLSFQKL